MAEQVFALQTYTPNSDVAAAFNLGQIQIIYGRTGNDALLGYQPVSKPGQTQIEIFLGDVAVEDPALRQWSDTFILGDSNQSYYGNGDANILGLNDFGLVTDFNPALDTIQLYGNASNYQLVDVGLGSAILQQNQDGADVVGFLLGNTNLSLDSNYFNYRGTTPPPGPTVPKAQQLGTPRFDLTPATTTDTSGNVYIAGATNGSLGGANNGDSRDAVVAKYDNQGNLLFTKQFGTDEFDQIFAIDTDAQGNFYVAGNTEGDLGGAEQGAIGDAFVAKFDSNGNQQWIETLSNGLSDSAYSIDVDGSGTVYLSGATVRPVEGEPVVPVGFQTNFWTSKFDTNGNQQWFTEIGTPASFDESYGVTVGNDGSIYATGWTLGGDVAAENKGLYDGLVAKFESSTGQVEFVRQFGTPDYEWSWSVDTDSQGNVYATGWTLGQLGDENPGSYDAFLTKFDALGNQLWIQQFGSDGDDEAFDLVIDSQDNLFITGYTNGSFGGPNLGSFDPWVARYDVNGNQVWLQQFGTPDYDQAYSITSDNVGNLYVTGITQGSLGGLNAGSFDSWVAKLDVSSGNLLNFGGTAQTADRSASVPISKSATQQLNAQQKGLLENFFEQFVTGTLGLSGGSGGPNGTGLEKLVTDPYAPPPTSVPEPSAGLGLLALAAFSCVSRKLRARSKASGKARLPVQ
ncbi:SBBP repeat-containing protein [Leptolyngbya sp. FACHB-261]|uniref:SBBP repeat-containing protein n=1 Tax=Leptolyngbya sp. FACHB-261 TaxID=2692806 RepID=UPI001687288A|nr:SBBP repeat-containing protein [Leptolyngbya sp. FACHB-261]MBD2103361.1 SBBP repeat-containing protein [Leptolyngbya sp. FACHB-261]